MISDKRLNVTFIQETHSNGDNSEDWRNEWNADSNSGGVEVMFSRDFNPVSVDVEDVMAGHILKIKAGFERVKMVCLSVYATAQTHCFVFFNTLDGVI